MPDTDDTTTDEPQGQPEAVDAPEGADDTTEPDPAAEVERWKRLSRKNERDLKAARSELDALKAQGATAPAAGDQVDVEAIRAQAVAEATQAANQRVVAAELRAAATGRLADPGDAHLFLASELAGVPVAADGSVDREHLDDLLADLIERKPHLAAAAPGGAPRFAGGADQGARGREKPKSLPEQIAEAESSGDWAVAQRLKARQLAELRDRNT